MTGFLSGKERYRVLLGDSFGMDPRNISAHDIDAAFEPARYGLHGPEYYGDGLRYDVPNPLAPRAPFPSGIPGAGGARFADMSGYSHEMELNERVRNTNLAAAPANHNISHRAQFMLVHPTLCPDGRFPADFPAPKTLTGFAGGHPPNYQPPGVWLKRGQFFGGSIQANNATRKAAYRAASTL